MPVTSTTMKFKKKTCLVSNFLYTFSFSNPDYVFLFLIAEHTKNCYAGKLESVKGNLFDSNFLCPANMFDVIWQSSVTIDKISLFAVWFS